MTARKAALRPVAALRGGCADGSDSGSCSPVIYRRAARLPQN